MSVCFVQYYPPGPQGQDVYNAAKNVIKQSLKSCFMREKYAEHDKQLFDSGILAIVLTIGCIAGVV